MTGMGEWLGMGGYGQYVWPCYALTLLTVVLNIGWARRSARQARIEARRRLAAARGPS